MTTPYEGSPLAYDYTVHPTPWVTLRDSTRLAADVYDVNSNTGEPLGLERRFTMAHQTVYHDAARPSHIVLPIIPADR